MILQNNFIILAVEALSALSSTVFDCFEAVGSEEIFTWGGDVEITRGDACEIVFRYGLDLEVEELFLIFFLG